MNNANDLINRQALCEYALNQKDKSITPNDIMRFPLAQPERKRGEWIDTGSGQECSVCGEIQYGYDTGRHYCANCGADMRTAKQIIHDAIDNTPMAEDEFVGIKEKLHKAVDEV